MKKKTLKKKTEKKPAENRRRASKIIFSGEPKAFRVENASGAGVGVIICDHASNRVPRSLKNLGLKKADLQKHIAWDIGAEDASRHLGGLLDMPVVLASYSRLVTDLNRAPRHRECMAETSDHIEIPANRNLSRAARDQRLKEIYWPYQKEVGRQVDRFVKKKKTPLLLAIHSFTPVMAGKKRPWHISVLWHREEKIAKALVKALRRNHPDFLVGENEPYTLFDERFEGSTMCLHAEARGLPYVFIEFRQDLIATREKAIYWAEVLVKALLPVLESREVFNGRKVKPLKF